MSLKRKAATTVENETKKSKVNGSITSFFTKPKTTASSSLVDSGTSEVTVSKFNKDAWVRSLTDEQQKLLRLEIDNMDESWLKELKGDLVKPSFLNLKRFLQAEKANGETIFPPEKDIYSWFVSVSLPKEENTGLKVKLECQLTESFRSRYTPLSTVKAVILGQDPYHNVSQAHGLSFSVNPPTPPPPSLLNIFKALRIDYPSHFQPPPKNTGQLTPWARQGVLMLNTCLTVRAHKPNSHLGRGWETFTQRVIDIVAEKRRTGVVFLAWGTPARQRVDKLDKARHLILLSVHPSPLSAHRGWFNCGHFRKTNEWLMNRYGTGAEIDWNLGENTNDKSKKQPVEDKMNTNNLGNEDINAKSCDTTCLSSLEEFTTQSTNENPTEEELNIITEPITAP